MTFLLQHFSPSHSLALKVSLKIITINCESQTGTLKEQIIISQLFSRKVQCNQDWNVFLPCCLFVCLMTMMKREVLSTIHILKNLTNWA